MNLLRVARLAILLLVGSGWGLLPKGTIPATDQPDSPRLTEAWHQSELP